MTLQARFIETQVSADAQGIVLVLHGGGARQADVAVSPTQLSVIRTAPIAARVARTGAGRLSVFRLLNSRRGWDPSHAPVQDVDWALGALRERFGHGLPICLIGHSLGGRAALLSAGADGVRSVVALAAWVYPDDGEGLDTSGRRILFVHGDQDRVAKLSNATAVAQAMGRTADVGFVTVKGGNHAMLRHGGEFERLAADFASVTLLGGEPDGTVARVLAGEQHLEV